ncbi:hypothetical protein [Acidithiobacillus ferridurans]|uniref:Uncharacterized protein n=1 Tax=Acidithiobacillus ferridurans TaxID=1232575 RepID=A0A8X8G9X5_ACIFI|nr:hypothetical protein [Acidithiobacillus ferridurans]MBU2715603.1 hypothetical protein [Acidithiobacillus ferridurans]MBU2722907.1 hypothetical protein [Acidithiobacillus ferridurans]MBU2728201.1 hypothetical protein [Acidithiobacillus ferridurans]
MAKIITVHMIVDDDVQPEELIRNVAIDYQIENESKPLSFIEDSITNDTYVAGDAFGSYVIFSHSEDGGDFYNGWWSNEFGWTTYPLATRFDFKGADGFNLPRSRDNDALWLRDTFSSFDFHSHPGLVQP